MPQNVSEIFQAVSPRLAAQNTRGVGAVLEVWNHGVLSIKHFTTRPIYHHR
eukprot:COSAG02_NODE_56534_length_285_cov_0.741935_1_plen_50_part_10